MEQDTKSLKRGHHEADSRRRDRRVLDAIPETVGPRLVTPRGGAIFAVRPPGSQTVRASSHFAAVMLAPAPGNRAALGSDRLQRYDAPVGALVVHPANVEGRAVWSRPRENLIVALRPDSLRELAAGELGLDDVSLQPPPFGTVDPVALRLAELLKAELTRGEPASELYVDSLLTVFSIHLLRNYTGPAKAPQNPASGLSMRDARRVREFLDENFTRKLSIKEMAAVAGLSPYYFIRAFARTFGRSPHQYVLDLRLDFAERLLVEGNIKIAEIAYLSGFSSQSHLTAAMKKSRQVTPAGIRRGR